jgi:ubiquinol-cytochrome c reductase iron-sulfur subunit
VRNATRVVVALLLGAALASAGFVALYVADPDTQLLGLALGLALCLLATAAGVAAKRVVAQETAVEKRPRLAHPAETEDVDRLLRSADDGVSRRGLLLGAAGLAGAGITAAVAVPAASLGPNVGDRIDATPWRDGRPVVDARGRPIVADDVVEKSFLTGFPQGADRRSLGAPIVIVRLPVESLRLPRGREGWAPEGILAFSKICTHAACAISLYRVPLYAPTSPRPALVCPCHYSTFDPARGAEVIFGPAGRPLPQLPLRIDGARRLVAAGGYSGSVGPAWWSAKRPTGPGRPSDKQRQPWRKR